MMPIWRFFIDVGGTFTDVVAVAPDGRLRTHKLLTTGAVRGQGTVSSDGKRITDSTRIGDPPDFWLGYAFEMLQQYHSITSPNYVSAFDPATGTLTLTHSIRDPGISYSLRSHEA